MIQIFIGKFARIIVPILTASILLASCSASEHAGISYKKRPAVTETNEEIWFEYWQDRLDALGGRVLAPSMKFPQVAHSAYERALQERKMKEADASSKTTIAIIGGVLGFIVLIYIINVASLPSTPSQSI